ncbi:uncharacterized protein J4E88_001891 [Alternaria novae-zelandiae]|uniref:uncharacterized protein n=1 Tax=Alternaria novae-zelandiae TaxID=430562 RepID=UPI0020C25A44|nr:uncharacterized protein J4E88_001891 [Alternaria novae-zelandiae]KAI4693518.1 hypothetical protein J4E88_001891 [Alternaria novae-zelandiae]
MRLVSGQNGSAFQNETFDGEVEQSYFLVNSAFGILRNDIPAQALDLPTGTCNDQTPCVNGACCSSVSGLCGYSPSECGAGNCSSNCDAKAECGQYGKPGKQQCPLGVCCSEFGKDGGSVDGINIGYYESWANTRACSKVSPEDLNLDGFTHLNFAFVFFHPTTFDIVPMDKNAGKLLSRFTKLKEKKPGLQTWVSVGGWSFNDPGPYQQAFSNMASTAANRKTFINKLIKFMDTYGFDGADLDWEYPTADDRGGKAGDSANFVLLSKDIKDAFRGKYGYTITLPASYWYLQHFDVSKHQESVDWLNVMSYDLHGVWDAASKYTGPKLATHTNITEINMALDLLWRAGVKPNKVVLGKGYYGRSFTLTDPSCNKPDGSCTFSGGAKEGRCSKASGILTLQEIQELIKEKNLKPVHDLKAGVKYGLMVWAIDQVDQNDKSLNYPDEWTEDDIAAAEIFIQDEAAQGVCYTTPCGEKCASGEYEASQTNGQPGTLSTMDRCGKGQFRRLCCAKGTNMGKCRWRGYRGLGLSCTGGCAKDETEITQNTNHHSSTEDQTCSGGTQSYCCAGFKPPITKEQVEDEVKDKAKEAALEAAEALALEVAATAFCRIAITAALTPLTFIPLIGWIIRLAVQAAVPALAKVCAKGIAKAGKSVFKFRGKDYDVKLDKPLTSKKDRDPPATFTKPAARCSKVDPKLAERARPLRPLTKINRIQGDPHEDIKVRTCIYSEDSGEISMGQACLHYSSVISRRPALRRLTCDGKDGINIREVKDSYYTQHKTEWIKGHMQGDPNLSCQRDEFPPAVIWQARDRNVWIRLIPSGQNGDAGHLFSRICDDKVATKTVKSLVEKVKCDNGKVVEKWDHTEYAQLQIFSLEFSNMPRDIVDQGITANPCWPKDLVDDPGFALMTNDPWYDRAANRPRKRHTANYGNPDYAGLGYPPGPPAVKMKRGLGFSPEDLYVDEGNSSRLPTEEELRTEFGLVRCQGEDCEPEMKQLGFASLPIIPNSFVWPPKSHEPSTTLAATPTITVAATASAYAPTTTSTVVQAVTQVLSAARELITESVEYAFYDEED